MKSAIDAASYATSTIIIPNSGYRILVAFSLGQQAAIHVLGLVYFAVMTGSFEAPGNWPPKSPGGWHLFLTWFIVGAALCLTCIGIPFGWQAIKISPCFPLGNASYLQRMVLKMTGRSAARGAATASSMSYGQSRSVGFWRCRRFSPGVCLFSRLLAYPSAGKR